MSSSPSRGDVSLRVQEVARGLPRPRNRHRGADQWLYVLSGTGVAIVAKRKTPLRAGTLLLIERGTTHEIRNTGRSQLKTLNVYVPPAYTSSGDELPRGKR